ncbi:MAG: aldolase [Paucimonas sp.]|nr:aldolase [Paucimonas sp.]
MSAAGNTAGNADGNTAGNAAVITSTGPVHRSWLFVPGNRPERFERALASGAHAVIIDLEDAVPAEGKVAARENLRNWLGTKADVYIRINAADTAWFDEDLALCGLPGVAGIVLPKADQVQDLARLAAAGARQILPLVESAAGMWQAEQLARQPRVARLVFGTIDFNLDMGIDGEDDELLYFRSHLVLVSRVAGIVAPIDGVSTAIDDQQAISHDTLRGRRLGFGGKLCIHPKQVPLVNVGYAPTAAQVAWARKVVQAAEQSGGAAVAVDGRMVDRPVILKAQETLREFGQDHN